MNIIQLNTQQSTKESEARQFALDVLTGLSSSPKAISAKYFYDDYGSELFQKITQTQDYYLSRTEHAILKSIKNELPLQLKDTHIDLIELGAGDGHKTNIIIEGLLNNNIKVNYYPIDISSKAMTLLKPNIVKHAQLSIKGLIAEYFQGLNHLSNHSEHKKLILFLGSNIGNFNSAAVKNFLNCLWHCANENDLVLIGFDLKKDIDVMTKAYNDSERYTQKFNLNLLTRINRELGGEFDASSFQHLSNYNPIIGAMESYLLSQKKQSVYITALERSFDFNEFEPIHLEYSHKYLESDILDLCENNGFELIKNYTDDSKLFIDSLWKVKR